MYLIVAERLKLIPLSDSAFYHFWKIIRKTDETVMGEICFIAPPNKRGDIELGYQMNEEYMNRGYMTESVTALCKWTLRLPDINSMIAMTKRDNIPSMKVLRKCGFLEDSFCGDILWRLSLRNGNK